MREPKPTSAWVAIAIQPRELIFGQLEGAAGRSGLAEKADLVRCQAIEIEDPMVKVDLEGADLVREPPHFGATLPPRLHSFAWTAGASGRPPLFRTQSPGAAMKSGSESEQQSSSLPPLALVPITSSTSPRSLYTCA